MDDDEPCECASVKFVKKHRDEFETLFEAKLKAITPSSAGSEEKEIRHPSLTSDHTVEEHRRVSFSENAEVLVCSDSTVQGMEQASDVTIKPEISGAPDEPEEEEGFIIQEPLVQPPRAPFKLTRRARLESIRYSIKEDRDKKLIAQLLSSMQQKLKGTSDSDSDLHTFLELQRKTVELENIYQDLEHSIEKQRSFQLSDDYDYDETEQQTTQQPTSSRPSFKQEEEIYNKLPSIVSIQSEKSLRSKDSIVSYASGLSNKGFSFTKPYKSKSVRSLKQRSDLAGDIREKSPGGSVSDNEMYEMFSERDFYKPIWKETPGEYKGTGELSTMPGTTVFEYSSLEKAESYLQDRNVFELFRFLGAHLVSTSPDNPIEFLIDLLEQIIDYKNGICMPPLLFELRHVESLYQSLDPMGVGEITPDQFYKGLFTLGITDLTGSPPLNHHLMINKETFILYACKKLKEQFDRMICLPVIVASTRSSILTRSG